MSKSVTVRDVPDEVVSTLTARAADQGRSLQEFLRDELTRIASRPSPDQWAANVQRAKAATTVRLSAAEILAARDADRP
ncbi:hypothetical protein MWU75_09560 [Ornithinimicrobium sp. F0845]|uniref:FitA-like ribbon-helix-helix domain-containing protein n=1 Tax=Ornithinimicrobium sp. F0845 TaxID=2926412 RepID=UPI001FF24C1E|nr:hypothetical protein [Ornithinimicrobium sp. F0845]MCK0112382.1 hypothetical protein [Ornithinimicrobium sp. F0845]